MAPGRGGGRATYRDDIDAAPPSAAHPTARLAKLGKRYPLALIALGVLLYSTGPIMLQSSALSGPAFSFWRLLIGAAALSLILVVQARRRGVAVLPSPRVWRWPVLAGLAFGVHQLMFMTAVKVTSVVDVSLMNALAPIITALGAWWVFTERPGRRFFAWSAVAIAGGTFLAVSAAGPTGDPVGMLLAVGNVVFFAAFFLASKRSRDEVEVLPFLAGTMVVSAVLVSAYVALAGEAVGAATTTDLALAAGVALGPGAIGHFVMTWPLRWVPANIPPVMRLAQPAIAGLLALLILSEPLSLHHLLGGVVVVVGAAGAVLSKDGRALQREARAAGEASEAAPSEERRQPAAPVGANA